MSNEEAEQIIEKVLQDNWLLTPIDWDNVKFTAQIKVDFIRLQIEWVDGYSVGPSRSRQEGIILLSVFVPLDTGARMAARYADELAALYRGASIGHLHIRPGRVERIGEREGWYQRNLLIPFYYDSCTQI